MAPEQILAALQKLDVNNDAHWTQDGLPRLETVRLFAGNQALTRDNITAASPEFTRLAAYNAQQAAQATPAPTAAPVQETRPVAQDTQAAETPTADPVPAVVQEQPVFEELSKHEQLEIIQAEIADMDQYLDRAKKHRAELVSKADSLIVAIDKETPKASNQEDIQAYLRAQNKILERRAEQITNVRKVEQELGARLADFVPKRSPIDMAMARRTGYGRKRPGT